MDHTDFLHGFTRVADKAMATSFPLASTCVIFVARVRETPTEFLTARPQKNRDEAAPTDSATTAGKISEGRRFPAVVITRSSLTDPILSSLQDVREAGGTNPADYQCKDLPTSRTAEPRCIHRGSLDVFN